MADISDGDAEREDLDTETFVENCLDEIRSNTSSKYIAKLGTKCDKATLGALVETAVKRGDAVDDVLKTIFESLASVGVDEAERMEEIADKRLFVFRKGIKIIQREGPSP